MRNLLAVAGLVLLGACDAASPNNSVPVGTYSLSTIDGQKLPVQLSSCLTVKSARIVFQSGATYDAFTEYGQGDLCVASAHEVGDVTLTNSSVSLKNADGGTRTLTRDGASLRETVSGKAYLYSH